MTLPFRGRHHEESTHDRAHALLSTELTEQLPEDDAAWLSRHLDDCAECRRDRDAFSADHDLMQTLRTTSPEPPRDLWARTAAAIDREPRGRRRGAAAAGARARGQVRWGAPAGAVAGVLALLLVVAVWGPRGIPVTPPSTQAALATPPAPPPQPTPLAVAAGDVGWVRPAADGRWELVISKVDEVCPRTRQGCEALGQDTPPRTVDLGGTPTGGTLSPKQDQLVVQSSGKGSAQPDKVYVVPLASSGPTTTGTPSAPPATETPTSIPTGSPVIVVPSSTPNSTPSGAIEIASGVTMVGEAAYSAGGWLAFSARPADGSVGPDLYLWHVGEDAATPVTTDHSTFFSGWVGNLALVSQVLPAPAPQSEPGASGKPAATHGAKAATPSPATAASPGASSVPQQFHPVSYLLDPATRTRTNLTQQDVWLPVVDPNRKVTAYWSGTVVPTADGLDWQLGTGQLVLDRWVEPGSAPSPSEPDAASSDPSTEPAADPSAAPSTAPLEVVGPSGAAVPLEVGDDVAVFKALFDDDGTRLAIWAADDPVAEVGRLHLVVLDPDTGQIDPALRPLAGEPALRRFSIAKGRLAWVSPSGQNGQESAVLVLGWEGRNFGEIQTVPAKDLFIVR